MRIVLLLLTLGGLAPGADRDDLPNDPYDYLTKVPSFYSLFSQKGLSLYSADVEIDGSIRLMLENMAKEKNLPNPEFMEFYLQGQGFKFVLKNPEYPAVLKHFAGEMFTPVLAFDRLMQTFESKRDLVAFEKFKAATRATAGWIQSGDLPQVKLQFTPRDSGGIIESREIREGENVKTVSTLGMTFVISPEGHLVKSLTLLQRERAGGAENEIKTRFSFNYKNLEGRALPLELTIEKNGVQNVQFKAVYRKSGKFIVFSRKIFRYLQADNTEATAVLEFKNYRFNHDVDKTPLLSQGESAASPERETEAEKLFMTAKRSIMDGKTREGKRTLKKILADFGETSYAGQAKTLLDGLPE